jgi:hypothetical protein
MDDAAAMETTDLEQLLAARDASQQTALERHRDGILQTEVREHVKTEHAPSYVTTALPDVLACWEIVSRDDPFHPTQRNSAVAAHGVDDNDDDNDSDDVCLSDKERQHIETLLRGYVADEDDTELIECLQRECGDVKRVLSSHSQRGDGVRALKSHNTEHGVEDVDDDDDDDSGGEGEGEGGNDGGHPTKAMQKRVDEGKSRSSSSGKSSSSGGVTRGKNSESKLSRNDRRSRVEAYFQKVVSVAPSQVVRFDYGGEPLWCTYPFPTHVVAGSLDAEASTTKPIDEPPLDATAAPVPNCEHCGARREFECQLMPGILNLNPLCLRGRPPGLDSSRAGTNEGCARGTPSAAHLLGDTFDFGVVAVYSCSNSCPTTHGGTAAVKYEFVVVQPPPDIAL